MRRMKTMGICAASAIAIAAASDATAQDYYLGQLIETGYNFCPRFTLDASGQLLSIAQNTALFALVGTTYGGNGQTTFALPDLRGRMVVGQGQGPGLSNYSLGQSGGSETETVSIAEMPLHTHSMLVQSVSKRGDTVRPRVNSFAVTEDNQYSTNTVPDGSLNPATIYVQPKGGINRVTSSYSNMTPFLVTRYCIVTQGVFPSRN